MKIYLKYIIVISIINLLGGCAADRISGSAKTIGDEIATYQGSLSSFQDSLKIDQDDGHARIVGTNARRDVVTDVSTSMQVEWMIANAKNATDIFSPLQKQGNDEVSQLLAPATSSVSPASVTFPIDKLGSVAKTMDDLSKGKSTQDNIKFLVNYGKTVNKQIKALDAQAKKSAETPAQPVSNPASK
jgi:hypothetical protein